MNGDLFDSDDLPCEPRVESAVCTNPLRDEPSAVMVSVVKQWGPAGLILGAVLAGLDRWCRRILSHFT